MFTRRVFRFDCEEIKELFISATAITFIFGYDSFMRPYSLMSKAILFSVYFLFVGLGFALHESAHKFMAISRGAWSRFVMWKDGLIFALFMKVLAGFTFIAPGATYWSKPFATKEDYGKVSMAGPITNIALALIFWPISLAVPIFKVGIAINLQLAMFNLLPIPPLDGAKIFSWKPTLWAFLFVGSLVLLSVIG